MNHLPSIAFVPSLLLLSVPFATPLIAQEAPIVVNLVPCEVKRPVRSFYVKSSRDLVRKGSLSVGAETFDLYLPKEKGGWSHKARPERKGSLVTLTSTWLAVDQDHDGKIAVDESYFAELPLRIGDSMFDVVDIAADGSTMSLRRREGPLAGAVVGRKAAAFEWTATDGRQLTNANYENRVLVIDCWAPG
ncbi:MAG: hypothetical protein MUC36_11640 [Planctomycetes bacterium]|jgi:hypothetical protein|nr:hypothetical protein [Planctomycetota bacterium]